MDTSDINRQAFIACERKNLAPDGMHHLESWLDGKTNFEYEKERITKKLRESTMSRMITVKKEDHVSTSQMLFKFIEDYKTRDKADYPWCDNFVLGQPLPDFQRDSVWTENQEISFIESIWYGYDIGYCMVCDYKSYSNGVLAEYSDCLIDGQQRFTAIEKYINDSFKVFGFYWSELTRSDVVAFTQTQIGVKLVNNFNRESLMETYNRLNFSGVNHTETDRA